VKPEIAKHELLFDLEQETELPIRFAWVMLFTVADREGRFKWRPRAITTDILPFASCDCARVLDVMLSRGLLVRYTCGTEVYGWIPTFRKHQSINNRERQSEIPPFEKADSVEDYRNQPLAGASLTRQVHAQGEGKGKEGKGKEGNKASCAEPETSSGSTPAPPVSPVVATMPVVGQGSGEAPITEAMVAEWSGVYPAVDVTQQLKRMRQWCLANPKRQKTMRGLRSFITTWLDKEQNQARGTGTTGPPARRSGMDEMADTARRFVERGSQ